MQANEINEKLESLKHRIDMLKPDVGTQKW